MGKLVQKIPYGTSSSECRAIDFIDVPGSIGQF
jgi:hypothetical protein